MSRIRYFGAAMTGALALVGAGWLSLAGAAGQAVPASRSVGPILTALAAHCDTMDGPVVSAAKKALAAGNVNLVLIWVQPKDELEIRRAFQGAMGLRKLGANAKELADRSFFETLVRVHRAGEGAPYTGLKPAGLKLDPAVALADKALATGSPDALVKALAREVEEGLRTRYREVQEARRFSPSDVKAGRKFVAAYVQFVHYAGGVAAAAASSAHGHVPEHEGAK